MNDVLEILKTFFKDINSAWALVLFSFILFIILRVLRKRRIRKTFKRVKIDLG